MALTRDFKKTVVARVERDLVNATLGFEQLAKLTAMPSKNLHRMLSPKGNPSMDVERCFAPLFLPIPIAVLDAHKPNSAGRAVSLQPLTHRGRFGAGFGDSSVAMPFSR